MFVAPASSLLEPPPSQRRRQASSDGEESEEEAATTSDDSGSDFTADEEEEEDEDGRHVVQATGRARRAASGRANAKRHRKEASEDEHDSDDDDENASGGGAGAHVKRQRTERQFRPHAADVLHALVPGVLRGVPIQMPLPSDLGEPLSSRVLRHRPGQGGAEGSQGRRQLPRRQAAPVVSLADWCTSEEEGGTPSPTHRARPARRRDVPPLRPDTDIHAGAGGIPTGVPMAVLDGRPLGRARSPIDDDDDDARGAPAALQTQGALTVRGLLQAGAFAGRRVEYKSRSGRVLLTATVDGDGLFEVQHPESGATLRLTASKFEALSGSGEKGRAGDAIWLASGRSLREVCDALNAALGHTAAVLPGTPIQPRAGVPISGEPSGDPRDNDFVALPPRRAAVTASAALSRCAAWLNDVGAAAAAAPPTSQEMLPPSTRDGARHQRLFSGSLAQSQRLRYQTSASGRVLATGQVQGTGICCDCCAQVFSPHAWEEHLGRAARRAAFDCIYTAQGLNLRQLAARAVTGGGEAETHGAGSRRASLAAPVARVSRRAPRDGTAAAAAAAEFRSLVTRCVAVSADACGTCGDGGHLLLCDGCPAAFHAGCVGLPHAPAEDATWFCPACKAAGLPLPAPPGTAPTKAGPLAAIAARCQRLLADLDSMQGGCALCRHSDFQAEGFGPRTVLLCDQCEREFHVECLHGSGRATLSALPPGAWFCQPQCESIARGLAQLVAAGEQPLGGDAGRRYTLHILRGAHGGPGCGEAVNEVQRLLCDSFDPILDTASDLDLLPLMVHASSTQSQDHSFTTMHSALLRCDGEPVCGACFRVFDASLAELPLVATASAARRQGHCAVLVASLEAMLARLGCTRLALPAAHEVERVWRTAFGFSPMADELLRRARAELRLLVFPGSRMLVKHLSP